MIDRCGRNIDYLRISVTDRCNLRCIYCMPEEGVQHVERSLILQEEEILRICRVMAELGIRKIKLTGGEPLVRRGIPGLIKSINNLENIEETAMTTNGILLEKYLDELAENGLSSLNISLDILDEKKYNYITRGGELEKVVRSIEKAIVTDNQAVKK